MRSDSFMGICFMALGMFLFSAVDTMAKFLSDGMHPVQIVWFRQLGLLCGVVVFLLLRGPAFLISKQPLLQVMRGVTAAGDQVQRVSIKISGWNNHPFAIRFYNI